MTLPISKSPKILHKGEGRYVAIGDKSSCTFKVVGEETNGQFGLFEFAMEPGAGGAKPHTHHRMTEIFYILEGEVELLAGDRKVTGRPGTLLLVPPDQVHGFVNSSTVRSVMLVMFCPADRREGYFEGLAELTKDGRKPSREELLDLMRRYDQEPVDEP
ncbi:MAG: cupin domain-containing protein [Candidatus Omnitrophica bacterium]|nr:cupin domain-containing protein [Candidatus Omnitrophota bacterium]MCA9426569.1 cupin domain-containing protein [Candidatus Omnitrophota bacterium]MCA9435754.1 cupin domain-containing protein [Candidatus Omnitrophota bacterium]MCA9442105.1 cupin domain-containing protein [Candidatus Omnitrophota bacterium]